MKKIFSFIIILSLLLSAVPVSAAGGYKSIGSRQELIDYVTEQAATMQPNVNVIINNYSEAEYNVDFTTFLPIKTIKRKSEQEGSVVRIRYTFTYTQAERILYYMAGNFIQMDAKETEALNALHAIYNSIITEDMTAYEKELAIHDYLALNILFDHSAVIPADSYTTYGALILGTAVCEGYAETARILLTMAGVPNGTLTGTADGDNHLWNVVQLDDGELYHMDVTWDADRILPDGSKILSRFYLNVTDEQMGVSHDWDKNIQLEVFGGGCTATEYNYLLRNGMVVSNNQEYINLVREKYNAGIKDIEVRFTGMDISGADVDGAMNAVRSPSYSGFSIPFANAVLVRFK